MENVEQERSWQLLYINKFVFKSAYIYIIVHYKAFIQC